MSVSILATDKFGITDQPTCIDFVEIRKGSKVLIMNTKVCTYRAEGAPSRYMRCENHGGKRMMDCETVIESLKRK